MIGDGSQGGRRRVKMHAEGGGGEVGQKRGGGGRGGSRRDGGGHRRELGGE